MSPDSVLPDSLAGWLKYIEALHPKSIAMGLDRVNQVKDRLHLNPGFPIITVAGTNGKGSTCAMLEHIYHQGGYRVACYTSPHFLRYNERVRIATKEAGDHDLTSAFAAVEQAREGIPLTYFEFGTLAAVWHFMRSQVDIAILEVGLGGRLDAVNAFETSCSIVTAVDFDHMEFLGNSRESIGYEKAGIYRKGIPAICGDPNPPQSLIKQARDTGAELKLIGTDFKFKHAGEGWEYHGSNGSTLRLPMPALKGAFQLFNAACVICAVECMQNKVPVEREHMVQGLESVRLAGRFQLRRHKPEVILDVAHNPQAADALAKNLEHQPCSKRTLAIFGMLADKDIAGVIQAIGKYIDVWYLADIHHPRGSTAQQLARLVHQYDPGCTLSKHVDVAEAYRQACLDAGENDRIIVFGSFYTVADVMRILPAAT